MLALMLALVGAAADTCTLSNEHVVARFSDRGLTSISLIDAQVGNTMIQVANDNFLVALTTGTRKAAISSGSLAANNTLSNATHCSFTYESPADELSIDVLYHLRAGTQFVSKALTLRHTGAPCGRNVTAVQLFNGTRLTIGGADSPLVTIVNSHYGLKGYVMYLRWTAVASPLGGGAGVGALLTAQNPFLTLVTQPGVAGSDVGYEPQLYWRTSRGAGAESIPLTLDEAMLGVHALTGRILTPPADPIDEAEHAAMVSVLRPYLAADPNRSPTVKINVAWTENDYQLDISLPEDRATYKRIIDRAAEYGLTHLLFGPRNSDISCARNNTDAWGWEQILWFGMGQRLRMGLWKPGDAIPASLQEMLDYFKLKKVKPVAYIYPILAFLAGTGPNGTSPPWIVDGTYELKHPYGLRAPLPLGDNGPLRSCLASPELQEWLPSTMLDFARALGAGGFGFDYTYFEENGPYGTFYASQYAQWDGWRTILSTVMADKTACGGTQCVVDNRQQNHAWGPWMWVQGGTYAEPLMSDEQPGSWMFFEADLHTDRLSANRQREVAYSYRQLEFCPPESLPGFAFHQTDRDPSPKQAAICPDGRCANASRARDFDLLGHRYSLLSSIATGGLNNVVCYLPARDSEEFERLPADEITFVRSWLDFTDRHTTALKKTKALPGSAAKPSFGAIDGTAMIDDDAKSGFVFLFNPSSFELVYNLTLDETLGFTCDDIGTPLVVLARILTSTASVEFKPYNLDLVACGEVLSVAVPPTTALALMLESWWPSAAQWRAPAQKRDLPYLEAHDPSDFLVLGVMETDVASYDPATKALSVHAMGEAGTNAAMHVVLPAAIAAQNVATVLVNGVHVAFTASPYFGAPAIHVSGEWGTQPRFGRSQQLCGPKSPSASLGGHASAGAVQWQCTFTVPAAMSQQLAKRNASFALDYDLDPQSSNEANVAWLAPGRLLVWLKYRSLLNDTLNVSGNIDGTPLLVRKAYNTIVPRSGRFIGHFADVTPLVKFGQQQTITLTLPEVGGWTTKPGALTAGSDVAQLQSVTVSEAQAACSASEACVGLTFRKPSGVASCAAIPSSTKVEMVYLKMTTAGNDDSEWCTMLEPPTPVGIFFENVETIYEQSFTQPRANAGQGS